MWQVHEMKAAALTRGGLTDAQVNTERGRNKVYREKSAEAIVPKVTLGRAERKEVSGK